MSKKIVVIFYDIGIGGMQKILVDFVNYCLLTQKDLSVDLIIRRRKDPDYRSMLDDRCVVHEAGFPYVLYILKILWQVKPHGVLTCLELPTLYAIVSRWLLRQRFNIVVHQGTFSSMHAQTSWLRQQVIRWIYPFVNTVVIPSKAAAADLVSVFGLHPNRLRVIPNWTLVEGDPKIHRDIDIFYCGRFDKNKRVMEIVKVIEEVRASRRDLRCVLVGWGEEEKRLKKYVSRHGLSDVVELLPPRKDVVDLMRRSKIFMLTSRYEGQPISMLEAMAVGVVPIVSAFNGVNEYLDDGKQGWVCEDRQIMVDRVLAVMKNAELFKKMQKQAEKKVRSDYGVKNIGAYLVLLLK